MSCEVSPKWTNSFSSLRPRSFELLLDEVLDGLDVVIRHALDLLDSEGILGGEAQIDIVEAVCAVLAEDTT